MISRKFGYLTVNKLINKGGQASIYLVTDKYKQKYVAKIYLNTSKQEVDILQNLKYHRNIIKINDFNVDNFHGISDFSNIRQGLLLPYFHNGDLSNKQFHPKILKKISKNIFKSIHHCHLNNICHRDIKPANFLLNNNSNDITLCDFGFAHEISNFSRKVGTHLYIAPEILNSDSYDYKCDIWSAGMTLLYINTNNNFIFDIYNHRDKFDFNFLESNFNGTVKFLPTNVKNALKYSLQRNPQKRLEANEIFQMLC